MTTTKITWDEPEGCTTPRGWLRVDGTCVGNYLDYGPGHYRSPHAEILNTINGPLERVWCKPDHLCRDCQPGNVHAVRYPDGPDGGPRGWRYFETAAEAREWIETGAAEAREHMYQVVAAGVALARFASETDARRFADETHIPGLAAGVVQAY